MGWKKSLGVTQNSRMPRRRYAIWQRSMVCVDPWDGTCIKCG